MANSDAGLSAKSSKVDLRVGACGLLTSLLTGAILWWIEYTFGLEIYSFMVWFVVPVGAGLAGFAGASGYVIGARIFNQRPTRLMLGNVVLAAVSTFFMVYYLSYLTTTIQGHAVSDYVSFERYVDVAIRSTSMTLGPYGVDSATTGQLGGLGYGIAFLQMAGFAVGGLAAYGYLTSIPYCQTCSKYFSAKGSQVRYTNSPEEMESSTIQMWDMLRAGAVGAAVQTHAQFGERKFNKDLHLRSIIRVRYCKSCGMHWINYLVERRSDKDWWKEIPKTSAGAFTQEVVDV